MHSEDGDEDTGFAERYGVWPTVMGAVAGAALIWFMFAFADGFA